jgi:hypothetical protein
LISKGWHSVETGWLLLISRKSSSWISLVHKSKASALIGQ